MSPRKSCRVPVEGKRCFCQYFHLYPFSAITHLLGRDGVCSERWLQPRRRGKKKKKSTTKATEEGFRSNVCSSAIQILDRKVKDSLCPKKQMLISPAAIENKHPLLEKGRERPASLPASSKLGMNPPHLTLQAQSPLPPPQAPLLSKAKAAGSPAPQQGQKALRRGIVQLLALQRGSSENKRLLPARCWLGRSILSSLPTPKGAEHLGAARNAAQQQISEHPNQVGFGANDMDGKY